MKNYFADEQHEDVHTHLQDRETDSQSAPMRTRRKIRLTTSNFVLPFFALTILLIAFFSESTGSGAGGFGRIFSLPGEKQTPRMELPFYESFSANGILYEAGNMKESSSPYWWLNSGGILHITEGTGKTNQGDLALGEPWQKIYSEDNPVDTDGGLHPQNVFRLLTRGGWEDAREEVYVNVVRDQFSESPNRNESNGVLLLSRYKDENNLYYAGIRVDGTAVIKKKYLGKYFTIAQVALFPGTYEKTSGSDLIPHNKWIGLRLDTETQNNHVLLSLFVDVNKEGEWTKIIEAQDDGLTYGGVALTDPGAGGIRTDFMDVLFDDYRLFALHEE